MDEHELMIAALIASPANVPLAQLLAPRLIERKNWIAILECIASVSRLPGAPTDLVDAVALAIGKLKDLQDAHEQLSEANQSKPEAEVPVQHTEDRKNLTAFEPFSPAHQRICFADVGGMDDVKAAARMLIIEPLLRPELFRKYGKAAGGGMLLYGPPGCGKTHFAKAIAGECGAHFFNVGIHDILNMYMGNSERNVRALFESARARTPAIVFIDELDALGRKRELMRHSHLTSTINAFLIEMDGATSDNDKLMVLGATNAPWDIDPAFKRPGRFDKRLFIPPPDLVARKAILELHLANRFAKVDDTFIEVLARNTEHFSGADLAAIIDLAAEAVLSEIMRNVGPERHIDQNDLIAARKQLVPSTNEWMSQASNHAQFANDGGDYADVAAHLQQTAPRSKRRFGFL